MIGVILAVVLMILPVIISLLLPTYTLEEERPKFPKPRYKFDPIAMAIRRLRS